MIEAVYVFEIPMSLPLDARIPPERVAEANRVLARAKEVGEEYENVEVGDGQGSRPDSRRRHRLGGPAARRGGDRPGGGGAHATRGGAVLGGHGRARDKFIGPDHALCRREGALQGHPHPAPP